MKQLATLIIAFFICSCSSSSNNALESITSTSAGGIDSTESSYMAPVDLSDEVYEIIITSGEGAFPSVGSYTLLFNNATQYTIYGDGRNTGDSFGTYTYLRDGAKGTIYLSDRTIGNVTAQICYNGEDYGTYHAWLGHSEEPEEASGDDERGDDAPASEQRGTFDQLSSDMTRVYAAVMAVQ